MSTLVHTNTGFATTARDAADVERKSIWRRFYEALHRSQERRAEREIANYLRSHGGTLTDDTEREIMNRLMGRGGPGPM